MTKTCDECGARVADAHQGDAETQRDDRPWAAEAAEVADPLERVLCGECAAAERRAEPGAGRTAATILVRNVVIAVHETDEGVTIAAYDHRDIALDGGAAEPYRVFQVPYWGLDG